jgi:hypothetical protein
MLPGDDRVIETCRSVLNVNVNFRILKSYICACVGVCN